MLKTDLQMDNFLILNFIWRDVNYGVIPNNARTTVKTQRSHRSNYLQDYSSRKKLNMSMLLEELSCQVAQKIGLNGKDNIKTIIDRINHDYEYKSTQKEAKTFARNLIKENTLELVKSSVCLLIEYITLAVQCNSYTRYIASKSYMYRSTNVKHPLAGVLQTL